MSELRIAAIMKKSTGPHGLSALLRYERRVPSDFGVGLRVPRWDLAPVRMQVALCALTLSGFASAPGPALAEPARDVALSVHTADASACTAAETLRALVEARIGSAVFSQPRDARRFIEIRIRAASSGIGFAATLSLRDAAGRTLGDREVGTQATRCDSLDPMLVLVISTLIGPTDLPPTAAKDKARPAQPIRIPVPAPDPQPDESEATGAREVSFIADRRTAQTLAALRFALGLSAHAISGLLPGIAASATIDLLARYQALELRAKVGATPRIPTDLGGGAQADFLAILGEAQACGVATERTGGPLAFCTGVSAGGLSAQTRGLLQNEQTFHAVVLLVFSTTLQLSIFPQQALLLGGGVNLPLLAPHYYYWDRPNERRDFHAVELGAFAEFGWLWHFSS